MRRFLRNKWTPTNDHTARIMACEIPRRRFLNIDLEDIATQEWHVQASNKNTHIQYLQHSSKYFRRSLVVKKLTWKPSGGGAYWHLLFSHYFKVAVPRYPRRRQNVNTTYENKNSRRGSNSYSRQDVSQHRFRYQTIFFCFGRKSSHILSLLNPFGS